MEHWTMLSNRYLQYNTFSVHGTYGAEETTYYVSFHRISKRGKIMKRRFETEIAPWHVSLDFDDDFIHIYHFEAAYTKEHQYLNEGLLFGTKLLTQFGWECIEANYEFFMKEAMKKIKIWANTECKWRHNHKWHQTRP